MPIRLFLGALGLACTAVVMPAEDPTEDPFAGLETAPVPVRPSTTWFEATLKREIFLQGASSRVEDDVASRLSIGGEGYFRFSSPTRTIAALDVQVRLVRRDDYIPVINDLEGAGNAGWSIELHNCYLDLYNVLNPFLSEDARSATVGAVNVRIGRFYLPFGLNLQTDTHGTILQLSNEQDFGFERDWYAGLWGALGPDLTYDVDYLVGSGHDLEFAGQRGLVSGRVSLGNRPRRERGIEGGISVLAGDRLLEEDMAMMSGTSGKEEIVETTRIGADARYSHIVPGGTGAVTIEYAEGEDDHDRVRMQLYQLDWLNRLRQLGIATQYRRYTNEGSGAAASIFVEATWYFRNEVGGSHLHWIKLNVEQQTEAMDAHDDTRATLQYYRYW